MHWYGKRVIQYERATKPFEEGGTKKETDYMHSAYGRISSEYVIYVVFLFVLFFLFFLLCYRDFSLVIYICLERDEGMYLEYEGTGR